MKSKHVYKVIAFVAIFGFFIPLVSFAKSQQGETVHVTENIDRNLYTAGQKITIDGNIEGDLIGAGSIMIVNGNVGGDIIAAGGQVEINGDVAGSILTAGGQVDINSEHIGGSIRVVGGQIDINSGVEKSVLAAGGTITISDNTDIGWSLTAATGMLNMRGNVNGHLDAVADEVTLGGVVRGDAEIRVNKNIDLGKYAKIEGDLTYSAPKPSTLDTDKISGEISYNVMKVKSGFAAYFTFVGFSFWLIGLISMIIIGLIITQFMKPVATDAVKIFWQNPWRHIGFGILFIIAIPIACILLAVTIIGIPIALISMAVYMIMLYLSTIFAGIAIGAKILKKENGKELTGAMILGIIIVYIVISIPVIGWILNLILTSWCFHAGIELKQQYYKKLFAKSS